MTVSERFWRRRLSWGRPVVRVTDSGPAAGDGVTVMNTGAVVGDIVVGEPRYRMRPLDGAPAVVPPGLSPSQLLAARHRIGGFTGREADLASLSRWRDGPASGSPRSARLLHGPGGQGKTRLAIEFADASRAAGWLVLAVGREPVPAWDAPLARRQPAAPPANGLLLIVDYAERWPAGHLVGVLADPWLRRTGPIRVLLLARPLGLWWQGLRHELRKLGLAVDEQRLEPLPDDRTLRRRMFLSAVRGFTAALSAADPPGATAPGTAAPPGNAAPAGHAAQGDIGPPGVVVPELSSPAYGLVLTVQMAALAAVDAARDERLRAPTDDPAALSAYLLDRETAHWHALRAARLIETPPEVMARTVYLATLTGPLGRGRADQTLALTGIAADEPAAGRIRDDHRTCYPPAQAENALEPLYPDRLAEDFLALQVAGHDVESFPATEWAAPLIRRLLGETTAGVPPARPNPAGVPPAWSRTAVTVLVEAARRWPHVAQRVLNPLLRERPVLVQAAGGVALGRLVEVDAVDVDVLEAIAASLPTRRHVELDPGVAALAGRLVGDRLRRASTEAERARLHAEHGWRLANAGQRAEALAATERAVDGYRRSVREGARELRPELVRQLFRCGIRRAMLGQRRAALAVTDEAAELARELVNEGVPGAGPLLAEALDSLGLRRSELGDTAAALAAAAEAYELLGRFDGAAAEHDPLLGQVANNLSLARCAAGQPEAALALVRRAVELRRELALRDPAGFEAELGQSLCNEGRYLTELGQYPAAQASLDAAVDILRRASASNPVYEHELAATLANLSACLWSMGWRTDALAVAAKAEAIYDRLSADNPNGFGPELRRVMANIRAMRALTVNPPPHRWGLQSFNS